MLVDGVAALHSLMVGRCARGQGLAFHICLLFPYLVKFLANTMQFNTTCEDYDSINQHSHQSTRTTGPQPGRGANHDHAQGGVRPLGGQQAATFAQCFPSEEVSLEPQCSELGANS